MGSFVVFYVAVSKIYYRHYSQYVLNTVFTLASRRGCSLSSHLTVVARKQVSSQ